MKRPDTIIDLSSGAARETADERVARVLSREEAEAVTEQYTKLVHSWAWKLSPDEQMRDDLVQEGFRALLHAAANRDHGQGDGFLGYASQYVRGAMLRFRQDWRWQVRLPMDKRDVFLTTVCLDAPADWCAGDSTAENLLERFFEQSAQADIPLSGDDVRLLLTGAMDRLTARQADVLRRRYWNGESYGEISASWVCSRQNVQICEKQALKRLRKIVPKREVRV